MPDRSADPAARPVGDPVESARTMSASEVRYEVSEHVATITLHAPHRMNTISSAMLTDLSARLLQADADRGVRCIVLTGAGRAFCAGLDLSAQASSGKGELG